jgi:hypothetical protein
MKYAFILTLPILIFFSGCKKYPEGGRVRIDAHSVEGVIDGPYRINELLVDNMDSTSSLISNPNYCPATGAQIYFDRGNSLSGSSSFLKSYCVDFPSNTWKVSNDRKQIVITFSYNPTGNALYPIAINQDITVTWDILRLNKTDLWMGTHLNGKEYYLRLRYDH